VLSLVRLTDLKGIHAVEPVKNAKKSFVIVIGAAKSASAWS